MYNMKIIERLKKGLKEFNEALGPDIVDDEDRDFPEDIKDTLLSSTSRVDVLEEEQKQLFEAKVTKRNQLANELSVHEDGTIKGNGKVKEEAGETKAKQTRAKKAKQSEDKEIAD
jgi:hypothetical protein